MSNLWRNYVTYEELISNVYRTITPYEAYRTYTKRFVNVYMYVCAHSSSEKPLG